MSTKEKLNELLKRKEVPQENIEYKKEENKIKEAQKIPNTLKKYSFTTIEGIKNEFTVQPHLEINKKEEKPVKEQIQHIKTSMSKEQYMETKKMFENETEDEYYARFVYDTYERYKNPNLSNEYLPNSWLVYHSLSNKDQTVYYSDILKQVVWTVRGTDIKNVKDMLYNLFIVSEKEQLSVLKNYIDVMVEINNIFRINKKYKIICASHSAGAQIQLYIVNHSKTVYDSIYKLFLYNVGSSPLSKIKGIFSLDKIVNYLFSEEEKEIFRKKINILLVEGDIISENVNKKIGNVIYIKQKVPEIEYKLFGKDLYFLDEHNSLNFMSYDFLIKYYGLEFLSNIDDSMYSQRHETKTTTTRKGFEGKVFPRGVKGKKSIMGSSSGSDADTESDIGSSRGSSLQTRIERQMEQDAIQDRQMQGINKYLKNLNVESIQFKVPEESISSVDSFDIVYKEQERLAKTDITQKYVENLLKTERVRSSPIVTKIITGEKNPDGTLKVVYKGETKIGELDKITKNNFKPIGVSSRSSKTIVPNNINLPKKDGDRTQVIMGFDSVVLPKIVPKNENKIKMKTKEYKERPVIKKLTPATTVYKLF